MSSDPQLANPVIPPPSVAERQWFIVSRWQEYQGEERANWLRILSLGAFYSIELLNYHGLNFKWLQIAQTSSAELHRTITALAGAWLMLALGVQVCLKQRMFPPALKYLSTGGDLVILSTILIALSGAASPVVVGYFLIIILAGLRFSLPLVWWATLGSLAGYLSQLGYAKWFAAEERQLDMTVPRYTQMLTLLALGLAGIFVGQMVRRVRAMVEEFHARVQNQRELS